MNDLIAINYDTDKPTVSGRELHEALEIETPYHKWFPRMCEYGFTENERSPERDRRTSSTNIFPHEEVRTMPKPIKRPATMWAKLPVVLDTEDVAIIFGITEVNIRAMARAGKIPCFKVGKNWRFEKTALMKFCGAVQEDVCFSRSNMREHCKPPESCFNCPFPDCMAGSGKRFVRRTDKEVEYLENAINQTERSI